MEDIILKDQSLLLYLNGLGTDSFDPFWLLITGKWFWIPFYVMLLYFVFKSFPAKKVFFVLIFIALGIAICDQLAGVFKYGFERLRPCHEPSVLKRMRFVICGGQFGFFSSHAANSFFLASFLSFLIGKKFKFLPYILFIWAIFVSYSRIYLGVHYPLDILVGMFFGILIGWFFYLLAKKVISKNNKTEDFKYNN